MIVIDEIKNELSIIKQRNNNSGRVFNKYGPTRLGPVKKGYSHAEATYSSSHAR